MLLRHAAADLVLGSACACCGDPGRVCCARCSPALRPSPYALDLGTAGGVLACAAALPYAGAVRSAVVAYKERRVLGLREPLARCLAASVVCVVRERPVVLVPVPSRPAAVRERGHDALADLARATARALREVGVDARSARCLAQRRGVRDQVGLDVAARWANLDGALRLRRRPPAGRDVVLVDDVVTSGASLSAAASVLAAAGAPAAAAAVVAEASAGPFRT